MISWRVPVLTAVLGLAAVWWWPSIWLGVAVALGATALLVALDWLIAAPVGEISLQREGPTKVRLGESVTVTLQVTNRSVRTLRAVVRDAWVPSAGASEPYAHAVTIDPGETATIETHLTPTRRGDRPAARVTIRSYGLLGLAFRQTHRRRAEAITPPWTLRTLPEFRSRRLLPEKLSRLRVIDGQVTARGRGMGTEFDSLREYVLGDDPRSLDWRASARREHLVVKQWRPERDRRVLCVIDTGRTSASRIAPAGVEAPPAFESAPPDTSAAPTLASWNERDPLAGEPRLDYAIDAALLLATLASHAGDRVDLLGLDTQTHASVTTSSKRGLPKLMEALAPLQPALVETDFGRVVTEVLTLERKRALVVIFTALDAGALGEGLLPVLPSLVARHTVVVAAVHDPALERLAADRSSQPALYTAAAAERGLAELRRVRAALVRYGVHVIDAPAETFASTVADTYLSLKAAGRL